MSIGKHSCTYYYTFYYSTSVVLHNTHSVNAQPHTPLLSVLTLHLHKAGHVLGFDHPDTSPGENLEQVARPHPNPNSNPNPSPNPNPNLNPKPKPKPNPNPNPMQASTA